MLVIWDQFQKYEWSDENDGGSCVCTQVVLEFAEIFWNFPQTQHINQKDKWCK